MTREEEIQIAAKNYFIEEWGGRPEVFYDDIEYAFKDGIKWADAHPAKKQAVTIGAWVAREKGSIKEPGLLGLYLRKPICGKVGWYSNFLTLLDRRAFSNITFENSPKKVKVTIEMEEE